VVTRGVGAAQLARLVGGWADEDGGGSLPALLGGAIEDLVVANALPDGVLLPPQRALATALGVSRSTVTEAYERLESAGVVETRHGSGSRVRRAGAAGASAADDGRMTTFAQRGDSVVDLSSGALPGLPAVAREYARLPAADLDRLVATDGYLPGGLPALREVVAARSTAAGLPTSAAQVLVTSGAQQAVWLLARTLLSPGDEVLVEDPSYRGALEAFQACGARLTTVPVRADGIDVDLLERLVTRTRYRALYVQPLAHNPTGTSMPLDRRRRLAEIAARHGITVIEDRCSEDLLLDGRVPPRPLVADLPEDLGVVVGTASKLLWGGLRVGWVRAAEPVVRRLTRIRQGVDLAGAPVDQLVATRLLADPLAPRGRGPAAGGPARLALDHADRRRRAVGRRGHRRGRAVRPLPAAGRAARARAVVLRDRRVRAARPAAARAPGGGRRGGPGPRAGALVTDATAF
jgi:DNA-binding transcriptional MocR family regulator